MKLKGKVALITGAGRGIGRAIAERFAGEGASLMLTSRTEAELKAAVAAIEKKGGNAGALAGDLSEEAFVARLVERTREQWGEIDILVNNAGLFGPFKPIGELGPGEWDEVVSVNLRAPFLLTRAVLPGMIRRGRGVVLNISSTAAKYAFGFSVAYAASKAGLLALTRTAAAEASRQGVRVNALCPGTVEGTRMTKELRDDLKRFFRLSDQQVVEQANNATLSGRPVTPEEVAGAALFLCSEDSAGVTGQAVNVDGGFIFY